MSPSESAEHETFSAVSVVVPVYNGEAALDELCERITQVLKPLLQDFEIIFVNGSEAPIKTPLSSIFKV